MEVMHLSKKLVDAHKRLSALSAWPHYYDGTHRSLARLKDSTSQLIGRFVLAAELGNTQNSW